MYKFCLVIFIFLAFQTQAETDDILTIERSVSKNIAIKFPNDKNINPKISDFEILNYVLMSNDKGERWAVVTLTNLSSGNRTFEHTHLMALFANGERQKPLEKKLLFSGNETQSFTLSFDKNKFPILSIYANNG
ncbi:hypothetical protein [Pseudoalteromonas denitrificans]|jgi:hypothetical protein|uniref:Uncharacterized protein n=1 Tax=Pseudoalteromonas denitrificans DSM 6059 TaxID=1123010 RepID=A0A1I1RBA8_9GAMM|nr:hypothetical protein [Pseudoalteromonas denitrificans]SFD31522.1 hypothetical protein SAMN02745724_04171 [Pseudoalteromonas denitrificans DSM 6059]